MRKGCTDTYTITVDNIPAAGTVRFLLSQGEGFNQVLVVKESSVTASGTATITVNLTAEETFKFSKGGVKWQIHFVNSTTSIESEISECDLYCADTLEQEVVNG